MIHVYPIEAVPAPRQSRRDQFARGRDVRPPVARYRAFRDELAVRHVQIPAGFHHVVFVVAMPAGWSKKEKARLEGMPHQQTPDRDNLEKALLDGVYGQDCHVWDGRTTKLWGRRPLIIISDELLTIVPPVNLLPCYQCIERGGAHMHASVWAEASSATRKPAIV